VGIVYYTKPIPMKEILSQVKNLITELSADALKKLADYIRTEEFVQRLATTLENGSCDACRHCGSPRIVRNGFFNGRQRYLCRGCGRTCTHLTGTLLHSVKNREGFIRYLASVVESHTLRRAAEDNGINLKTSFNRRHKFLHALGMEADADKLSGTAESDGKYFPFPARGRVM